MSMLAAGIPCPLMCQAQESRSAQLRSLPRLGRHLGGQVALPMPLEQDSGFPDGVDTGPRELSESLPPVVEATSSASKQTGRGRGRGRGPDLGEERKQCSDCKKLQSANEFQDRQTKCKTCRNGDRQLASIAKRQELTEWLEDMKKSQGKEYVKLRAALTKSQADSRGRRDFCLHTYKERVYSKSFTQGQSTKKYMWEGEYVEWAKSAEAGFLTKAEADANWAAWDKDDNVPHDFNGPRGYKRILIHKGDFVADTEEVGREKALESQGRSMKKITDKQKTAFTRDLVAGHDDESCGVDFAAIREAARQSLGHGGSGSSDGAPSALSAEGLLVDNLKGMAMEIRNKIPKRKGAPQSSAEEQPDEDANDPSGLEEDDQDRQSVKNNKGGASRSGGIGRGRPRRRRATSPPNSATSRRRPSGW